MRQYHPWSGWKVGPIGTVTDDMQMTMCIAESIVAVGTVLPADIARRFAQWLEYGRGKGRTCVEACHRIRDGVAWHAAGVESAGNGAAMRTAPIGLFDADDLQQLRLDAALVCLTTHAHPTAIASAIALSAGVAYCLALEAAQFDPQRFIDFVLATIDGVERDEIAERRPGGTRTTLARRLAELPGLLGVDEPRRVYDYLYNGAFVLESLPTAIYAFLKNWSDFEGPLSAAVDAGHDCDTSAAMACALSGALLGRSGIPECWLQELEYRDTLLALADGLHALSRRSENGDAP